MQPADIVTGQDKKLAALEHKFTTLQETSLLIVEHLDYFCSTKELCYSFLSMIDKLLSSRKVTLIGTTSNLAKVDLAFRRGGRFDFDIRMDAPDERTRLELFKHYLAAVPNEIGDADMVAVSRATSGFVTSDIAQLVRNATLRAVSEGE